jgi:hypothetical protein
MHQRQAGFRRTYSYDGSYAVNSEGTWYFVTVRCEGRVSGTPMGILVAEVSPDENRLRSLVHRQIEDLDQVLE